MNEAIMNALNEIDGRLCKIEEFIFNDPFSAKSIDEKLGRIKSYWEMEAIKINSMNALRDAGISYPQSSSDSNVLPLSVKKQEYNDNINVIERDHIIQMKNDLTSFLEKFPNVDIALSLLDRCVKCENEIPNIRNVINKY